MMTVWRIRRKLIRTVLSCVEGGHKPGTLREFSEPGKLGEFSGKNYNFSTIEYLRKTTVDWVNRILMISGSSEPA